MITEFKNFIKTEFKKKHTKNLNYLKSKLLTYKDNNQNRAFTLYDKYVFEKKTIKAKVQDEITSVSLAMKNKIVVFNTPTLSPELNLNSNKNNTIEKISNQLKKQYEEFQKYSKKLRNYNYRENKEIKLFKFKSVSAFEVTKKVNIHRHNIDLVNDFEDLLIYLRVILLKRKDLKIGRIELAIDEEIVNKLVYTKQQIKINNKYQDLTFKYSEKLKGYIIENSKKGAGNFVYIKPIKDLSKDKTHLTKYLFKYLLKSSNETSLDSMIFSYLGFKQKQYTHNFFTNKLKKHELEKLSSIVYNLKRFNKTDELDILPSEGIMFNLASLFNDNTLRYEDNKLISNITNNILYSPKKFEMYEFENVKNYWNKKRQVLEKKREINDFLTDAEECELHNIDMYELREKEYIKKNIDIETKEFAQDEKLDEIKLKLQSEFRKNIKKNTLEMGVFVSNEDNFKWEKESSFKREKSERLIFHKLKNKKLEKLLDEHYENYMKANNLNEIEMSKGINSEKYEFIEVLEDF